MRYDHLVKNLLSTIELLQVVQLQLQLYNYNFKIFWAFYILYLHFVFFKFYSCHILDRGPQVYKFM